MGLSAFETRVPGKWVLAGEHAVIRGAPAVALPHPEFGLSLRFEPSESPGPVAVLPKEAESVIRGILGALKESRPGSARTFEAMSGLLQVESTIPEGAGLGSSAALCVAVTRWLSGPLRIAQAEIVEVATRLEDLFHGRSSGMDIAAVAASEPVLYVRGMGARALGVRRLPRFTFHDTGLRASTRECVLQVEALRERDPDRGARLDALMGEASLEAARGLELYDSGSIDAGLARIARAMDSSHECYEAWGLVPKPASDLRQQLIAQGALSARLTGAGRGGMIVALWR